MSQSAERKKENEIPSGKIEWRTNNKTKQVEISANSENDDNWLDVTLPKTQLIEKIKEQLKKDKKNDEEKTGFKDVAENVSSNTQETSIVSDEAAQPPTVVPSTTGNGILGRTYQFFNPWGSTSQQTPPTQSSNNNNPTIQNNGGKKSKKRRNKNKRHTRKNKK
jgi:hypothetical protein